MVRTAKYCNVYQTVFHWFVPKTFDCKFSKSSYQGRYLARDLGGRGISRTQVLQLH